MYDPEIVFFADRVDKYQAKAHFEMAAPNEQKSFRVVSGKKYGTTNGWDQNQKIKKEI